jgi:peptidoglycan/xylan/chitin deacetylase (PgdA/CDA1 family)
VSCITLNFHGVGPVSRDLDASEHNYWLDQRFFEAVLGLARGQAHVCLTCDDGNASDVDVVLPMLLRHGLQATFFVCSGRLGQPTFLSCADLRELQAQGMTIGSHGVVHMPWRHLSPDQLRDELEGSRRVLEDVCGRPVDAAACPFGAYDRAVLNGLRRAGYRLVYTSDGGVGVTGHWLQPRTTVTRSMTLSDVQRLVLQGTGVWEQALIDVRKCLKRLR